MMEVETESVVDSWRVVWEMLDNGLVHDWTAYDDDGNEVASFKPTKEDIYRAEAAWEEEYGLNDNEDCECCHMGERLRR